MKWLAFLFFLISSSAQAFDHRPALQEFRHELRTQDMPALAARTDLALDNMIRTSVVELRRRGHSDEADRIEREWAPLRGSVYAIVTSEREVPEDYAPLYTWLSDWYHSIRGTLGVQICTMLHFDDVQVLNWGTPVVFHMDVIGDAQPDAQRYELYFDPWCGVVAYWTVWGICIGAGGAMVCTPAAMLAEEITVRVIAPYFAERTWEYFYKEEDLYGRYAQ